MPRTRGGTRLGVLVIGVLVTAVLGQSRIGTAQAAPLPVTIRADTGDLLSRALDAEDRSDWPRAIAAYQQAIEQQLIATSPDGDRLALAVLGLERVVNEGGQLETMVGVIERVIAMRPADPTARAIQLRTLTTLSRDADARTAFEAWRRAAATDGAPYREYARLLLQKGRALAADSVLQDAARRLGRGAALSGESAQLHVALQRWGAAAAAFREALAEQPWLETAALFALQRTPMQARDSVREALTGAPPRLPALRVLANLELAWGDARRAWSALARLPVDDSTLAAWRDFGERTELGEAWLVARDVWRAVFERTRTAEVQQRAAQAALRAGDAAGALTFVRTTTPSTVPASPADTGASARSRMQHRRALLAIEIEALGELGRAAEAQQRLAAWRGTLDEETRQLLARPLVGAWLRAGNLVQARAAMTDADLDADDELAGWIALYAGDLVQARKRLVRASSRRTSLVDALGVLARVRLDSSVALGTAFLILARGDSVDASRQFETVAEAVGPAAPALLAMAARLASPDRALGLWQRIVREHPRSPEAPEGLLASARIHRDRRGVPDAITRLEQLLIEYPSSALAPQARRELDRLKGQLPPSPQ